MVYEHCFSPEYELFYKDHVERQTFNFTKLIITVYEKLIYDPDLTIPVGDPLHLWKSVRPILCLLCRYAFS